MKWILIAVGTLQLSGTVKESYFKIINGVVVPIQTAETTTSVNNNLIIVKAL